MREMIAEQQGGNVKGRQEHPSPVLAFEWGQFKTSPNHRVETEEDDIQPAGSIATAGRAVQIEAVKEIGKAT
jgi:hypothetical protein